MRVKPLNAGLSIVLLIYGITNLVLYSIVYSRIEYEQLFLESPYAYHKSTFNISETGRWGLGVLNKFIDIINLKMS